MNDLERAKTTLEAGGYTCVIVMKTGVFTSAERGIKPLLEILDKDMGTSSACAADKVVGKAAAFLYELMGISKLYAGTLSEPALKVLKSAGIEVEYGACVSAIRNRTDTGYCPMESAVWEIADAKTAYEVLKEKVKGA